MVYLREVIYSDFVCTDGLKTRWCIQGMAYDHNCVSMDDIRPRLCMHGRTYNSDGVSTGGNMAAIVYARKGICSDGHMAAMMYAMEGMGPPWPTFRWEYRFGVRVQEGK
ncbi:hypothetical protein DPMN_165310 [Dreissena polymorpha]|uniref:Uncharacterized protein n=1 Tax=Dreissena polymorpha TaxID=45954 RepID=A0A9D4IUH6_DREPO|nr:hypothetical protein DPMN_165310 [Dreissena polymorpha]